MFENINIWVDEQGSGFKGTKTSLFWLILISLRTLIFAARTVLSSGICETTSGGGVSDLTMAMGKTAIQLPMKTFE